VVFPDQGKPPKTTNNTDEKGDGNEDADSPAPDKPLDVGEHYVVRRPDGSLREFFPYVWYLHAVYSGGRGLKSYKEFSTMSAILKRIFRFIASVKIRWSSYGRTLFFNCSCSNVLQKAKGEVTV
jgi:hypothetical protein